MCKALSIPEINQAFALLYDTIGYAAHERDAGYVNASQGAPTEARAFLAWYRAECVKADDARRDREAANRARWQDGPCNGGYYHGGTFYPSNG